MYKQRTNSKETISLIELKVYHSKIRRTESYSRYTMNLKRIVVEFGETINISKDDPESPREQVGSADPRGGRSADPLCSCLLSPPPFAEISFSMSLAKLDPKP